MRLTNAVSITVGVLWLAQGGLPLGAACGESEEEQVVSGRLSVAGKYDSNVDLLSGDLPEDAEPDEEIDEAFMTELSALLLLQPRLAPPWRLEVELYGLGDLHVEAMGDSWYTARGNLSLGYGLGASTISLLNEGRYLSEPDDTEFDNYRNTASLVWTHVFSDLWQARLGYESIVHVYPESDFFNYHADGGFVEARNTWTPTFSTYYAYHFHYYQGTGDSGPDETLGSPESSNRHTVEVGFESFLAGKGPLLGTYTFQADDSSGKGAAQIGEIRGEDENLEPEAEFDFIKHKGTLLYSHELSDRLTLSLYGELIHKTYSDLADNEDGHGRERTDTLLLSSVWLTVRLHGEWYLKPRYLYRMNQSTFDSEDFQDHIAYLGLEYRF
ncbi:MAG: hypothetical protein AB1640_21475 [bacterium]